MNFLKTLILVIIIAIIIGALIFFIPKILSQTSPSNTSLPTSKTQITSTPTPLPTVPPVTINESSNLKEEAEKIIIPDFKSDFDQLRSELN